MRFISDCYLHRQLAGASILLALSLVACTESAKKNNTLTAEQLLTGGSSKTWKLDNTVDSPIVVGPSDKDPTSYFPGLKAGELPECQADDEYTFSTAHVLTYDAKDETYTAITYECEDPRSGTSPFAFSPAVGTKPAQFTLTRVGAFVGTTDAAGADRTYRIVAIDDQHMTLRSGSGLKPETTFTFKMVAK